MKRRLLIALMAGGSIAAMLPGVATAGQPSNLGQCIVHDPEIGTPADNTVFHVGAVEQPGSTVGPYAMVDGYDTALLAGGRLNEHIPMTGFVGCAKP